MKFTKLIVGAVVGGQLMLALFMVTIRRQFRSRWNDERLLENWNVFAASTTWAYSYCLCTGRMSGTKPYTELGSKL